MGVWLGVEGEGVRGGLKTEEFDVDYVNSRGRCFRHLSSFSLGFFF